LPKWESPPVRRPAEASIGSGDSCNAQRGERATGSRSRLRTVRAIARSANSTLSWWRRRSGGYNACSSSQATQASATSGHPLSMVREWPRSSNSTRLVFAGECRYCLSVDLLMDSGTVWSLPPTKVDLGPSCRCQPCPVNEATGWQRGPRRVAARERGRPISHRAGWIPPRRWRCRNWSGTARR
jgi:hypothetical protein